MVHKGNFGIISMWGKCKIMWMQMILSTVSTSKTAPKFEDNTFTENEIIEY